MRISRRSGSKNIKRLWTGLLKPYGLAVPAGALRWSAELPAVGDWVRARRADATLALIEKVEPFDPDDLAVRATIMAYVPERSGTLADERELPSMRSGFPRDFMRTSAERISREAVSTTEDHRFLQRD